MSVTVSALVCGLWTITTILFQPRKTLDNVTLKVYNFHVEDHHTYSVGKILVHNAVKYEVQLSRSKYPESAKHIEEAIADGQPSELTIDRKNASKAAIVIVDR